MFCQIGKQENERKVCLFWKVYWMNFSESDSTKKFEIHFHHWYKNITFTLHKFLMNSKRFLFYHRRLHKIIRHIFRPPTIYNRGTWKEWALLITSTLLGLFFIFHFIIGEFTNSQIKASKRNQRWISSSIGFSHRTWFESHKLLNHKFFWSESTETSFWKRLLAGHFLVKH